MGMVKTVIYDGAEVAGQKAVAVGGGRILALGPGELLRRAFPEADLRQVAGRFSPAFLDGHLHLLAYGRALGELDLAGLELGAAREALLAARAARAGWLRGRGASTGLLAGLAADQDILRRLAPLRVWAHDLHTLLSDPESVRALGLDRHVPPGGAVERGQDGLPTGLLRETAALPLAKAADEDEGGAEAAVERAIRDLWRRGIVGAVTFETPEGVKAVASATGRLPFRAYVYQTADSIGEGTVPHRLGRRAALVGAKFFLDGTLGSRTAWLQAPYADAPGLGLPRHDPDELRAPMQSLARRGFSLAVHAIGDAAAEAALGLLAPLPPADAPHRIEHLQLVPEGFSRRLRAADVTASIQPCHLDQDLEDARRAWADRLGRAYPYHALCDAGVRIALGSDAPVESPSPALNLKWALGADAVGGGARHRLDVGEALRGYREGVYGSVGRRCEDIAPGAPADLALYRQGPEHGEEPLLVLSEGQEVFRAAEAYVEQ